MLILSVSSLSLSHYFFFSFILTGSLSHSFLLFFLSFVSCSLSQAASCHHYSLLAACDTTLLVHCFLATAVTLSSDSQQLTQGRGRDREKEKQRRNVDRMPYFFLFFFLLFFFSVCVHNSIRHINSVCVRVC